MSKSLRQFLGLEHDASQNTDHDPRDSKFAKSKLTEFTITPNLCSPRLSLYGGVGLAVAIESLEAECERPVVMATTQFIGQSHPDQTLKITNEIGKSGNNFTQASSRCTVDDNLILATQASLGLPRGEMNHQWNNVLADVPKPGDCDVTLAGLHAENSILSRFEVRPIDGPRPFMQMERSGQILAGNPRSRFWARIPECSEINAASLSVLADIAPSVTTSHMGAFVGGSSLDNTIRMVQLVPSDWILCEVELHSLVQGIGHTTQRMWSQSGELLAVATQSFIAKLLNPEDMVARGLGAFTK